MSVESTKLVKDGGLDTFGYCNYAGFGFSGIRDASGEQETCPHDHCKGLRCTRITSVCTDSMSTVPRSTVQHLKIRLHACPSSQR
jgi:hypothetical protein